MHCPLNAHKLTKNKKSNKVKLDNILVCLLLKQIATTLMVKNEQKRKRIKSIRYNNKTTTLASSLDSFGVRKEAERERERKRAFGGRLFVSGLFVQNFVGNRFINNMVSTTPPRKFNILTAYRPSWLVLASAQYRLDVFVAVWGSGLWLH